MAQESQEIGHLKDTSKLAESIFDPNSLIEHALNGLNQPNSTSEVTKKEPVFDPIAYEKCKDNLPSTKAKLGEFLKTIVETDQYDLLLKDYTLLSTVPEFEEEVGNAAMRLSDKDPRDGLPYLIRFAKYDKNFTQEPKVAAALNILAERLAASDPEMFLLAGRLWQNTPDAQSYYIQAVETIKNTQDAYRVLIVGYDSYKDFVEKPQDILEKAVWNAEDAKQAAFIFKNWSVICNNLPEQNRFRILYYLANHQPEETLQSCKIFYKTAERGKEVLTTALRKLPYSEDVVDKWYSLPKEIRDTLDVSFLKEAILNIVKQLPDNMNNRYKLIKDEPWAVDVLNEAFKLFPNSEAVVDGWYIVAKKLRDKLDTSIIQDAILNIARQHPDNMKVRRALIKDEPWATNIIKEIDENERVQGNIIDVAKGQGDPGFDANQLISDPSLRPGDIKLIQMLIPREYISSMRIKIALSVLVARNLFQKNIEINAKTVEDECKNIAEKREKYGNIPLFYKRNICLITHNEQFRNGFSQTPRFGRRKFLDRLKEQQSNDGALAFYHDVAQNNTTEELKKARDAALINIQEMPPPATFIFRGHGSPDALWLAKKEVLPSGEKITTGGNLSISDEDFAEAWAKRSEKFGAEAISKDIVILASCYNHNFVRSIYDKLKDKKAASFISAGSAEYGQVGYTNFDESLGSDFLKQVLRLNSERSTLGDVWDSEEKGDFIGGGNPYVYVPDNGVPIELTEQKTPAVKKGEIG